MGLPGYKLIDAERTAYWRTCACVRLGDPRGPVPPEDRPPAERLITEGGLVLNLCSRCRGLRA